MRVRVLFFGMLKDIGGTSAEEVELPDGADLRAVFEHLRRPFSASCASCPRSIVMARNQEFADALDTASRRATKWPFCRP